MFVEEKKVLRRRHPVVDFRDHAGADDADAGVDVVADSFLPTLVPVLLAVLAIWPALVVPLQRVVLGHHLFLCHLHSGKVRLSLFVYSII